MRPRPVHDRRRGRRCRPADTSGASVCTCSPRTPRRSRVVASTATSGQVDSTRRTSGRTVSRTCSQLSRITSVRRVRRCSTIAPSTSSSPIGHRARSATARTDRLTGRDRRQLDHPHAVGPAFGGTEAELGDQARLAHPARPAHAHQAAAGRRAVRARRDRRRAR